MDNTNTIGRRLQTIRQARKKSQAVVAGLAGITQGHLSRLESGDRALDRRSLVAALARALDVAPSEIIGVPTSPGTLEQDGSVDAVRLALLDASMGEPDGTVSTVDELDVRARGLFVAQKACEYGTVGTLLPGLIRDLNATLDSGRDVAAVTRLHALVHVQGAQAWIGVTGVGGDLAWQAANLARVAAERVDDPLTVALSGFGTGFGLLGAGSFDKAARILGDADPGTGTGVDMQVSGMLALTGSLVSAAQGNSADRVSALDYAADLADRTGEGNALWFGFGPANVGVWRMSVLLEAGEYADAVRVAQSVNPDALPNITRRAMYWREYGRALARLPKRRNEAVMVLRRAERMSPARIQRHPFMLSLLAELLSKPLSNQAARELRGMAHRAGLPA